MASSTPIPITTTTTTATDDYLLADSSYHNPFLTLTDVAKQTKVTSILSPLALTCAQIERFQLVFGTEMNDGLCAEPKRQATSNLLMLNTFVPTLNSVSRDQLAGDYISLDIGSSNFRVLHTRLSDTGAEEEDAFAVKYYNIPPEYRKGDSTELFTFLANCIIEFVSDESELVAKYGGNDNCKQFLPLGFTFSFPMKQLAIDVGLLQTWTKNFDLPDAVGVNIAAKLQEKIDATGNRFNIKVVTILNDATGTLVKGMYIDTDCAIGLILGTGSNACYLEQVERVEKWQTKSDAYGEVKEVMINMECGALGDNGSLDFVRTKFDRAVDSLSLFPGSFTFEKYLGGQFLGEILRFMLLELATQGVLFGGVISPQLNTKDSLKTSDLSAIEGDHTKDGSVVHTIVSTELGYEPQTITTDDVAIIRYACARLSIRVATLLAAMLSTLIRRIGQPRTVIAVDGSVYRKHPRLHRLISDFTSELLDRRYKENENVVNGDINVKQTFEVITAEDGSGKGAGIVAAVASKMRLFGGATSTITTQ